VIRTFSCATYGHQERVQTAATQPTIIVNDLADFKAISGGPGSYHHFSGRSDGGFGGLDQFLSENRVVMKQVKAVKYILTNVGGLSFPMSELTRGTCVQGDRLQSNAAAWL
jgi:hypothetical protein